MRDFVCADGGLSVGSSERFGILDLGISWLESADKDLTAGGCGDDECDPASFGEDVGGGELEGRLLEPSATGLGSVPFELGDAVERNVGGREAEIYLHAADALEHGVWLDVGAVGVLDADDAGESGHGINFEFLNVEWGMGNFEWRAVWYGSGGSGGLVIF